MQKAKLKITYVDRYEVEICPTCGGKGTTESSLSDMVGLESDCSDCEGKRYVVRDKRNRLLWELIGLLVAEISVASVAGFVAYQVFNVFTAMIAVLFVAVAFGLYEARYSNFRNKWKAYNLVDSIETDELDREIQEVVERLDRLQNRSRISSKPLVNWHEYEEKELNS